MKVITNELQNLWSKYTIIKSTMLYHLKKCCNSNTLCTQGHTCSASDVCVSLTIEFVSLSVLNFVHPFCNLSMLIRTQSRPTVITLDRSSCRRLEQLFCKCYKLSVSINMKIYSLNYTYYHCNCSIKTHKQVYKGVVRLGSFLLYKKTIYCISESSTINATLTTVLCIPSLFSRYWSANCIPYGRKICSLLIMS